MWVSEYSRVFANQNVIFRTRPAESTQHTLFRCTVDLRALFAPGAQLGMLFQRPADLHVFGVPNVNLSSFCRRGVDLHALHPPAVDLSQLLSLRFSAQHGG